MSEYVWWGARLCGVANARRLCPRSHRPRSTFGSPATWERPNRLGVLPAPRCLQGRPERSGRYPGRRRSDRARSGRQQRDPSRWDSTNARAPRGSSGGTRLRDAPTAWPHCGKTRPASIKRGCVAIGLPHRSCARATPGGRVWKCHRSRRWDAATRSGGTGATVGCVRDSGSR